MLSAACAVLCPVRGIKQFYYCLALWHSGTICGKAEGVLWWMEPLGRYSRVLNGLPREHIEGPTGGFLKANARPHPRPDPRPKSRGAAGSQGFWPWVWDNLLKSQGCSVVNLFPREVPRVLNLFPRDLIEGPPQDFRQANPLLHLWPDPQPKTLGAYGPSVFWPWPWGTSLGNRFTTLHPRLFNRLSQIQITIVGKIIISSN